MAKPCPQKARASVRLASSGAGPMKGMSSMLPASSPHQACAIACCATAYDRTGVLPVALDACRARRTGEPIRRGVAGPAASQEEGAVGELFERKGAPDGTQHRL